MHAQIHPDTTRSHNVTRGSPGRARGGRQGRGEEGGCFLHSYEPFSMGRPSCQKIAPVADALRLDSAILPCVSRPVVIGDFHDPNGARIGIASNANLIISLSKASNATDASRAFPLAEEYEKFHTCSSIPAGMLFFPKKIMDFFYIFPARSPRHSCERMHLYLLPLCKCAVV